MRIKTRVVIIFFVLAAGGCATPGKNKEQAALHLQLAISLVQKDNYPLALQELLVAQELDPSNATTQSYLGLVYFFRERMDLSEKHYKQATVLNPHFTDAKNNLARVYIEQGRIDKAEVLLKEVLVDYTYVDFPRAYFNYGLLEFKRKHFKEAGVYLQKTIQTDRENCLAHVYLGRSYLELAQNALAADQLAKAIKFCEPLQVDDAHYFNAISLFRNNQKDLAVVRFQELLKIFPAGKYRENAQKMIDVIKRGDL